MKKILSIALIAFLSASFITVSAGKKKKKETVQEKPVLVLTTGSDTLSYAAGYANTEGLIPFLLNQKVDTAYIADFIRGLNEYFVNTEDPAVVAYRKGLEIGQMLQQRAISGIANELKESPDSLVMNVFLKGFNDALENDTTIYNMETAKTFFNNRMQADIAAKKEMKYGKNREAGAAFLAENAKKEGVKVTASGLQYKVIEAGKGEIPTATQTVRVKYEGKLIDGTVFDSSYKRSDPITEFPCNRVIKGWTEALTMMPAGSKWELYIPYDLAYGDQDMGQIPPYSTLIFTVELVEIKK